MMSETDYLRVPSLENYYHGFINRATAEERLKTFYIPNSYLLRLSRIDFEDHTWEPIYVLSYLSSSFACYHFKLIPRYNCFQLGGRFFDTLEGCLSRYYARDIMTGERLRYPIPPTSVPIEFHVQRMRAIHNFEPDHVYDHVGCAVNDRFLFVSEDPQTNWVLVTSLKSRHSGYLPKCYLEKEYPELIERLDFFHPELIPNPKELLKKVGPCSYLVRPCDSRPGLYTLLLYDGDRVRKSRLEVVTRSELIADNIPSGLEAFQRYTKWRRSSGPAQMMNYSKSDPTGFVVCPSPVNGQRRRSDSPKHGVVHIGDDDEADGNQDRYAGSQDLSIGNHRRHHHQVLFAEPLFVTKTVVLYNGVEYPHVEAVIKDIELQSGPWNGCLEDSRGGLKPVRREPKSYSNNPPSSDIYMSMYLARQPSMSCQDVIEIHGEMSIYNRKKWKSYYAQLDRKQSVLILTESSEKRKSECFDLAKCDFYPIHPTMHNMRLCFGLILYGACAGDKDEIVFSIDAPNTSIRQNSSFNCANLDPRTYAGRSDDFVSPGAVGNSMTGSADSSNNQLYDRIHAKTLDSHTSSMQPLPASSMDITFNRWIKSLKRHCRNTKVDAANEDDSTRKQTRLRCFRILEFKFANAKLIVGPNAKPRRDESLYIITLDGIEVAHVCAGRSVATILFDEFPYGFGRVEVLVKEDKRKRTAITHLDLTQLNSSQPTVVACDDTHDNANANSSSNDEVRPSQQQRQSFSSLCHVQEQTSGPVTIVYRELYVIPFQYYEQFRLTMRQCLQSELVPLCIHVWESLPQYMSKLDFATSLLVVTTELNCHLDLILHLLRMDIHSKTPGSSFRSNTFGTQILDLYFNTICLTWRSKCFDRVRQEALNGPPTSTHVGRTGKLYQHHSTPLSISSRSGGSISGHNLTTVNSNNNNTSSLDQSQLSGVANSAVSPSSVASSTSIQHSKLEQNWYYHLVSIAVDDLIECVHSVPIQMRWIYSELQALQPPNYINVVVSNLVFLRGLCPVLSSRLSTSSPPNGLPPQRSSRADSTVGTGLTESSNGSWTVGNSFSSLLPLFVQQHNSAAQPTQSSSVIPQNASDALVFVAKMLLAFVSVNVPAKSQSEGIFSTDQFNDFRKRLLHEFTLSITSQLSPSETKQLKQSYEAEVCRVSRKSLSRELAKLANYFLQTLTKPSVVNSNSETDDGRNFMRLHDHHQANHSPPATPTLYASLMDLVDKTQRFFTPH